MIASSGLVNLNRETVSRPSPFRPPKEDELREFVNLSLNLLCIAGVDGYFKYVNPAWETTLGYTQEELLSHPYLDFVHPEDREVTVREASHIASGRSTISFENRYLCKNGSFKWLLWSAVVHPERGLIYGRSRLFRSKVRRNAFGRTARGHTCARRGANAGESYAADSTSYLRKPRLVRRIHLET